MATKNSSKIKVLMIEDDQDMAILYYHRFQRESELELIIASDGHTGIKIAHHQNPDLTLLDLILPDLPGWEVLKRLKQDPDTISIPVIILSNLYKTELVEKGLKLGAEEDWSKTEMMPTNVVQSLKKRLGLLC